MANWVRKEMEVVRAFAIVMVEGGSAQGMMEREEVRTIWPSVQVMQRAPALPTVWGAAGGGGCWGDPGPSGQHRQASFFPDLLSFVWQAAILKDSFRLPPCSPCWSSLLLCYRGVGATFFFFLNLISICLLFFKRSMSNFFQNNKGVYEKKKKEKWGQKKGKANRDSETHFCSDFIAHWVLIGPTEPASVRRAY